MDSGSWIRKLREEKFLRAREVERLSRAIVAATGSPDFYVSHASLADIEAGAVPSIYKLFSLACFLGISYDALLRAFGVNQRDTVHFSAPIDPDKTTLVPAGPRESPPFPLSFTSQSARQETDLLQSNAEEWPALPLGFFKLDPQRYRYALVGSKDDTMGELIPPGSLVEVDTQQNVAQMSTWRAIRERPIYLVWHANGYSCCWCQQERGELIMVPHPSSEQPVRRFKTPRDATIVGRVVAAWMSFAQLESSKGPTSLPM
jgi:transcriptional regulator with XRE-family HTH domain